MKNTAKRILIMGKTGSLKPPMEAPVYFILSGTFLGCLNNRRESRKK